MTAPIPAGLRFLVSLALAFLLAARLAAAPERWVAEIAALTAADATRPPPADGVVFVGSSSIRLWTTLAEDFPGVPVINRGFGGSELTDSVHYADRIVLPYRPRMVVVYAGENDLWAGRMPAEVVAAFRAFVSVIHAQQPQTRIVFLSIKESPSRARVRASVRETNRLIAEICASDPQLSYVDVATPLLDAVGGFRPELYGADQLHLSPAGYALWRAALAPHLRAER